jgi:pimeloyl-ACP methyl ester carboxylesterase
MTIMEKKAARQLLFSDLPRKMARTAINSMQPQYRPSEPPLPEKHDIPGTYIWDPDDPVREPSWVLAIADALELNTVKMRGGGHALHLSRPGELAQILGGLAGSTMPYTRVPQQRRTQIPMTPPQNADAL